MANTVSIDDVLSKFVANEVDSTEVIKLLLTSDETGIDYLQNLKKDFKDRYVTPTFNKAKDYYSKIGKKIDDPTSSKDVLNHINDPLGLKELRDEYKKKSEEVLKKNLDKLDLNLKLDGNNSFSTRNSLSEQQTLTEKTPTVSLSDETVDKLGGVLSGINAENLKKSGNRVSQEESSGDGGGLLGTLGALLLAGGVGALLISAFWDKHIKPWLEDKLDLNFDAFDKFEGIVEGIGKFFTMGGLKIGGGWLFNLVGKAFTTFGDLLEGGLKAIFKLGFGDDVVKAGAAAAPAAWKTLIPKIAGGLFRGVGTAAFKTIPIIGSLISFYYAWDRFEKGDTIAGIIDLVGGISNLLSFTPLAPLALPLSIGASALNAFLDYKAGGANTMEEKQAIKMDYLKDLGFKIYDFIKETPLIGGVISSLEGFVQWSMGIIGGNTGEVKQGLSKMTKFPLFGALPSIMLSLLEATTNDKNEFVGLDVNKFINNLKKDMLKTILGWFPSWFGIRHKIANFMGIELDGSDKEDPFSLMDYYDDANKVLSKSSDVKTETENSKKETDLKVLEEDFEKTKKELSYTLENYNKSTVPEFKQKSEGILANSKTLTDLTAWIGGGGKQYYENHAVTVKMNAEAEYIKQLQEKLEILQQQINKNKPTDVKRDDFSFRNLMTSTQSNSILFDSKTNTANVLDQGDNILAYKTDGVFDRALKELTELAKSINKGIYKIPEKLENINTESSPVVVSNNSGERSNMMDVILSGTRPDSIYNFRRSIQGEFA
jgi:hypothetical protein